MSGKARPSMRKNVLDRLDSSNLSETSKDCIKEVFERYEEHVQNADFVEVVRCKDCVHLKQTKNGGWCKLHNTFPLDNYYCANGKKELK